MTSAVPITGRPSACDPNTASEKRSCTSSPGVSSYIAISSSTTSRSWSSSAKRGAKTMSVITCSASSTCRSGTREKTTVCSREVAPIQKPIDTERTLGTFSEMTRSPESSSERTYFCTAPTIQRGGSGHEPKAAAGALGFVERGVGEPEQRVRVARMLRAGRDAEARANVHSLLRDSPQRGAGVTLRRVGQQQRELVTPDAKRLVA